MPRGRNPINLSFHTILYHPLGRDHRQDVIGDNNRLSDKFIYNTTLASLNNINNQLIHPSIARSVLKNHLKITQKSGLGQKIGQKIGQFLGLRPNLSEKSEFSREMLMFPLSIKNPDIPLMLGRSKKKIGPPKFDPKRYENGPEKYVYITRCVCVVYSTLY